MRPSYDEARGHRGTVAVVEDDRSLNTAMGRLLEAAGFRTYGFTCGGTLLAHTHVCAVDCFVLDVHLPDMSGFELRKRLNLIGALAPAIVITAHDDTNHRRAAQAVGAFAYFAKPISGLSLLDAVGRALAHVAADRG